MNTKEAIQKLCNEYGFIPKVNCLPYSEQDMIIWEVIIENTIPRQVWSSGYNMSSNLKVQKESIQLLNRLEEYLIKLINSNNKTLQIIPKTVPQMEKETKKPVNKLMEKEITFALYNKVTNSFTNIQKYTAEDALETIEAQWDNFSDSKFKEQMFGEEHNDWELIVFACPSNPTFDLILFPGKEYPKNHSALVDSIIMHVSQPVQVDYKSEEEQYNLEKELNLQSNETTENTEKIALTTPVETPKKKKRKTRSKIEDTQCIDDKEQSPNPNIVWDKVGEALQELKQKETPLTFQNFIGVQKTAGNEYSEYIEHLYKFYMQGKLSTFAFVDLIREMIQYIDAKASSLTPPIATGTILERSPKKLTSKSNTKALLDKEPNTPYLQEDIRKIGKYGELFMVISTDLAMGKTTDEVFVDTIAVAIEQMKDILYKVDSNSLPKYTEKDIVRAIQLARKKDENNEDDDLTNEEIFGEIVHTTDNKLYTKIEEEIGDEDMDDFWDEVMEDEEFDLEEERLEKEESKLQSHNLEVSYSVEAKEKSLIYNLQDLKNAIELARREAKDGHLLSEEEIVLNVQYLRSENDAEV